MTTHADRGDSGTQPDPHYCTGFAEDESAEIGCPDWPECLFADSPPRAAALWTDSVEVERARHANVASHSPEHTFTKALVETLMWTALVGVVFGLLWAVLS